MVWILVGTFIVIVAVSLWMRPAPLIWLSDRSVGKTWLYMARQNGRYLGREAARETLEQYKDARSKLRWLAGVVALVGLMMLLRGLS